MSQTATKDLAVATAFEQDAESGRSFNRAKRIAAWRRRILPTATIIGLITLWEASVWLFAIPKYVAPAPSMVAKELVFNFPVLMENLLPTAFEAAAGFVLGNLLGILLAILFVYRPTTEEALLPVFIMINSVPMVAKAPILVLLMGNGMLPKITIAAVICFFPTLVYMARGLRDLTSEQIELMKIVSASEREILVKLRFRAALPHLFSALKIATSACVVGAIIGEWIGSKYGIGALIVQATFNFDSPLLYSAIFLGSLLASAFFIAVSALERKLVTWKSDSDA